MLSCLFPAAGLILGVAQTAKAAGTKITQDLALVAVSVIKETKNVLY